MSIQSLFLSRKLAIIVFVLVSLGPNAVIAKVRLHWEAKFSNADQRKLTQWVVETHAAIEALVGELPFDMHIYFHKTRAGEPVPWANTERSRRRQGVHFHVDPRFSLQDFRKDWTASHEMSHLIIPYLGRSNAWFAEGFASYMQYQVMKEMGVLSQAAMEKRYMRNLKKAERNYNHHNRAFAQAAPRLRREGRYPTMYWGGAAYFLQVNDELMSSTENNLVDVLKNYVACCRRNDTEIGRLVAQLDRLASTKAFTTRFARFQSEPGFPDFKPMIPNAVK